MTRRRWLSAAVCTLAIAGGMQACVFGLGELESGVGGAGGSAGATGTGGTGASGGGESAAWWDDAYDRRRRLTLGSVDESLTDVAIPVFLDASFDYAAAEPGGADLRFVAADGATLLPHEIERYDPGGGTVIWVRVPAAGPGGDDHVWLYYDNDGAPAGEAPLELWAGYLGVLHMADPASGATVTNSANDDASASPLNLTAANEDEGPLGQTYRFDGGTSGQGVLGGDAVDYDVPSSGQATVELWFRRDAAEGNILVTQEGCCLGWALRSQSEGGVLSSWGTSNCCQMGTAYDNNAFPLPGGAMDFGWHHYVVIYDRGQGTVTHYRDGQEDGVGSIAPGPDFGAQSQLLVGVDFAQTDSFAGAIDEIRFRHGAYEPARIALHAASATPGWLTLGPSESR